MAGRCGFQCEEFIMGNCDIGDEICEAIITCGDMSDEEIEFEINECIEPVKLFVLRGEGKTQLDLLCEAWGYKR
jgi:hypothetical protein